jgi:hypothetical protein
MRHRGKNFCLVEENEVFIFKGMIDNNIFRDVIMGGVRNIFFEA